MEFSECRPTITSLNVRSVKAKIPGTEAYEFVAASGELSFRKQTVERLASLYYAEQDFEQAFYYYEQVLGLVGNADGRQARLGLMRCAKSLDNVPVMQYAESLLQDEALPTDWKTEALLNAARSAYELKDSANAKLYYLRSKQRSRRAQAEATYHLAEFDHVMGKYEGSNDLLFWMIENLPTYPKWRWNSLILMAKNTQVCAMISGELHAGLRYRQCGFR